MCGCYEVRFQYAETFSPIEGYEKKPEYKASALEWVQLIEDEDNLLSLQHLLLVGPDRVIKHWRQDWEYEAPMSFQFLTNNRWELQEQDRERLRGTWTQKVYQVDDSPRYAGTATWIHSDGKQYWEDHTPSPLPRREYTKRDDYNLMIRGNRHEITDYGWVHEQDNQKVISKSGEPKELVAQEKGWNTYRKVEDSRCAAAKEWWKENREFWASVRASWDSLISREGILELKSKVDDKRIYEHLADLKEQGAGQEEITSTLRKFIRWTDEESIGR